MSNIDHDYTNGPPTVSPVQLPQARKRRWLLPTIVGVVTLLVGVGIGSAGKSTTPSTSSASASGSAPEQVVTTVTSILKPSSITVTAAPPPPVTVPVEVQVTVTAGPPPATFKDGINLVGVDVQPGTYRTDKTGCYYERLSATSGTFEDILANGNGATVITIEPTDVAFNSERCAPWAQVG